METWKIRKSLNPDELPKGFVYPEKFNKLLFSLDNFGGEINHGIEPWTIITYEDMNSIFSIKFGLSLVQFAQCWKEEMVAFFVVGTGPDPVVMVFDPWALKRVTETKWIETGKLLEQFPNFEAWLAWVRNSELAKEFLEDWIHENPDRVLPEKKH
ncbi:hypothetical protein [Actimicrobium antarcticum]|uniref:SMI1/KNR4 family protein n=1 Tax=Actimicrobium antarcticum TaxID=1051899 RepID=A0ABP7SXJ3_9BURK